MQKYSSEEQAAHLATWRSSGLSGQAYCRQHNIVPTTFYGWIKAEKKRAKKKAQAPPLMVKVQRRKQSDENLAATICIECDNVRIHLPAEGQMESLKSVLMLLGVIDAA